jgi:serine/threonine protein kinase/predicted Zn-dependent protease
MSGSESEREKRLARAVASFIDRIEAGEKIDPDEVYRDYPDLAEEILEHLRFVGSLVYGTDPSRAKRVLGDYVLIREIGQGGMGAVVHEAFQVSVERKVALKVLGPFWAADPKVAADFLREARIAAQLNHPHVVPVYDSGIEDKVPYYAMELVLGDTLAARIARARAAAGRHKGSSTPGSLFPPADSAAEATLSSGEPIPGDQRAPDSIARSSTTGLIGYRETLEIALAFAGAADGLEHAHEKRIIHRDIKPSNLIFDTNGRLRILDFGLARLLGQESLYASKSIAGTLPYMSPEQALPGKECIDRRTDIYSMGATLYEVLTLRPPFTGEAHEVLDGIADTDPVRPRSLNPHVHRNLEAIVLQCLRKSPRDRYQTAADLAMDLRLFASGQDPVANPPSVLGHVVKVAWRKKLPISAVVLAVFFVVFSGLYLHLKSERDSVREREAHKNRIANALFKLQGEFHREARTAGDVGSIFQDEFFGLLGPALEGSGAGFGALEESVKEIQQIARDFPRRPDASYHLARLYDHLEKPDKAMDALKEALRRDRNFLPALLLHASLLFGENSEPVQEILAKHSGNPWASTWLEVRKASQARKWDEAATHLGEMIEAAESAEPYEGALLEMRLERAMAHVRPPAQPILARGDLAIVTHQWPNALELELLNAVVYFMNGDQKLADATFEHVYNRNPSDAAALWIAGTYFTLAPSAPSIPFWLDKVKKERLRDMGYFVLYCWKDPYEKAVELGEKILGEAPGDAAARIHSSLCWPLNYVGRYREAREHAEQALQADPNLRWAHLHLGKALFFMGEPERAMEMFHKEMDLQPGNPWVPAFASNHLIDAGFIEDGLALAKEAVSIDPKLVRAWRYVGDAYYYTERFLDANQAFGEVSSLDSKEKSVVLLNQACALSKLRMDYQEKLDEALSVRVPKPHAELRLGWIRQNEGDENKALEHFETAAGAGDAFWRANFGAAGILEEREPLEALRRYQRVMKVNPNHRETHTRAVALVRSRVSPEDPGVRETLKEIATTLEEARAQGVTAPCVEHTLAFALLHGGGPERIPEALELAVSAAKKLGDDPEVLATLAEAQLAAKDQSSAVMTLERALDLPGARDHLKLLAPVFRREALPDLPTCDSIDEASRARRREARTASARSSSPPWLTPGRGSSTSMRGSTRGPTGWRRPSRDFRQPGRRTRAGPSRSNVSSRRTSRTVTRRRPKK